MSQTIAEGAELKNLQLVKKIAAGGMAEVWEAKQVGVEGFERRVAVKVVLSHLSDNEEFIRMFFDEGRLAARLNHSNICQILDLNEHNGVYFMAMEFIDGFVLSSIMKKAAKRSIHIPFEHCCQMILDSCAGLDYAHSCLDADGNELNLVHRDISPQNIMITRSGTAKVVDFGIAKAATQVNQTRAGVLKGKYAYMSPEQATGKILDLRSDVFALGVVLWELTTGHRLFRAENEIATLHKIIGGDYEPPSALRENYPPGLETIVMKALAPNVEDRFQNCGEMQLALEEFLLRHGLAAGNRRLSVYLKWLMSDDDGEMPVALQTSSVIEQAFDHSNNHSGVFTPTNTKDKINLGEVRATGTSTGIRSAPAIGIHTNENTVMFDDLPPKKSSLPWILLFLFGIIGLAVGGYLFLNQPKNSNNNGKGTVDVLNKNQVEWMVQSNPSGAILYVGSENVGTTPTVVKLSTQRSYIFLLKKAGFQSQSKILSKITPEMVAAPLTFQLKAQNSSDTGSLFVEITPKSATVKLDGTTELTPITPGIFLLQKISSGSHVLLIESNGYKKMVHPFEVVSKQQAKLSLTLSKGDKIRKTSNKRIVKNSTYERKNKATFVTVLSSPSGASVFINGKEVGTTPLLKHTISAGTLAIRLEKNGYLPQSKSISLEKGNTETLSMQLEAKPVKKEYASVSIGSNIPCKIYINKKYLGKTPQYNKQIRVGKKTIEFRTIQYNARAFHTVSLEKGKKRIVHRFKTGTLQILSRPMGGVAFLNDFQIGSANKTYSNIPVGSYTLRVDFKDGKRKTSQINISSGSKTRSKVFGNR